MAQVRKVITKINRYLIKEEANYIIDSLKSNNYNCKLWHLYKWISPQINRKKILILMLCVR